jgi:hypothetical protein
MWMALRVHSFTGLIGPTSLKGDREMNVSPMCTGTICLGVLKTDPGSWQGTFFGSSCFHPKKETVLLNMELVEISNLPEKDPVWMMSMYTHSQI